jgi:glycerol kinase
MVKNEGFTLSEEKYVASIDQGTTGTRFMVFDHAGSVISSAYEEHEQIFPKPGWVEHDPLEIWSKTQKVMRKALESENIDPKQIQAIGVTNQRETTVLWSKKTGMPVYNAIVWQCRRTAPICDEMKEKGLSEMVREKTGLVIDAYFSGPKIKWILDNDPGVRERAEAGEVLFGNIDTWVIWNLTRAHITDYSNASRTMIFDINKLDWDDEILEELGIPRAMLPEPRPSSDTNLYGYTMQDTFFNQEVPVCGDLGDQQAAVFGQTCYSPGDAKNTYGTGCFMLLNTGTKAVPSKSGLVTTVAYGLSGEPTVYALEGSIFSTGAAIQWLRDGLRIIQNAAETEDAASSVPDTGGVYFVPAFVGLGAPYWDMYARGTIVGLTRGTTREHLIRATLESICFQTKDVLEAMVKDSGIQLSALKVDGGAVKNNFLMQLQSDILGVPCIRPTVDETTALGAAYAAGLAVGYWKDLEDLKKNWGVDRRFEPEISDDTRRELYEGWKKAVKRATGWIEP